MSYNVLKKPNKYWSIPDKKRAKIALPAKIAFTATAKSSFTAVNSSWPKPPCLLSPLSLATKPSVSTNFS